VKGNEDSRCVAMHLNDIDSLFEQAMEHHRQGRPADALALYDAVIASDPQRGSAHFNRGLVLQALNRADEALESFDRAIALEPDKGDAHYGKAVTLRRMNRLKEAVESYDRAIAFKPDLAGACLERGNALRRLNRFEESLRSYDQAIAIKPDFAEAYSNKGSLLRHLQRLEEALRCFDLAIALRPGSAELYSNRGVALQDLRRLDEALQSYDHAIALKPDYAVAHNNKGNLLRSLERPGEALRCYDRAIALEPDLAEAHHNKGTALKELKRFHEAIESYDRAIALKPDYPEAYCNRGAALQDLGQLDAALHNYDRAIALRPNYAEAYHDRSLVLSHLGRWNEVLLDSNKAIELRPDIASAHCSRGNALTYLKRIAEAIESYDRAIALKPDDADAYWNKSLRKLLTGDVEEGWALYEWRKKRYEIAELYSRSGPCWSGRESLEGKALFIYAEQGLGDTIQFCRYALLAREHGAKIILAVQPPLVRLLNCLGAEIEIVPVPAAAASFDYHIALMSLPLAFGTRLETCPAKVPYVQAEPDRVAKWKRKVGSEGFKVGIGWQGNKQAEADAGRSFPVRHFEDLARLPNVRLISLQKNDGVEQLQHLPAGMKVETLGEELDAGPDAFVDTAAVMECLDLVITSDTAIAHLAGALGRPVWVALQFVPDWRWLLDRSDSPWYPTMKLFRQPAPGDWVSVFAAIQAQHIRDQSPEGAVVTKSTNSQ
jgi:tetratricopeptide (TPR) repeat protein